MCRLVTLHLMRQTDNIVKIRRKTMKKKSIEVNSKITKKAVKTGAVFQIPIDRILLKTIGGVLVLRDSIVNLKTTLELAKASKEKQTIRALKVLLEVTTCSRQAGCLSLLMRLFKKYPMLEGYAIGFNTPMTTFQLSKGDGKSMTNYLDAKVEYDELEEYILSQMGKNKKARKSNREISELASKLIKVKSLGMDFDEACETAKEIQWYCDKIDTYNDAKEKDSNISIDDFFTADDISRIFTAKGTMKKLSSVLKADLEGIDIDSSMEGGIA